MLVAIFVAAVIGLLIWGYQVKKERQASQDFEQEEPEKIDEKKDDDGSSEGDAKEEQTDDQVSEEEKSKITNYHIEKSDCQNECSRFKTEEALKHCKEVCGLIPVSEVKEGDSCDDLSGLEKDYCLRDSAIADKNFELCQSISDKLIFRQCKERILEDIVDQSSHGL